MSDFIDVSDHNGPVDWAAYRAAGHTLAAIKATEGLTYTWAGFQPATVAAHAAGVQVYAYHFLHRSTAEAAHFLAEIRPVLGLLSGVVVDYEADATAAALVAFQTALEAEHLGKHQVVYSFHDKVTTTGARPRPHWDLWLAAYVTDMDRYVPAGWPAPWAWQFTDAARVPGVTGTTDLSHQLTAPTPAPKPTPAPPAPVQEDDMAYTLIYAEAAGQAHTAIIDGVVVSPVDPSTETVLKQLGAKVVPMPLAQAQALAAKHTA